MEIVFSFFLLPAMGYCYLLVTFFLIKSLTNPGIHEMTSMKIAFDTAS